MTNLFGYGGQEMILSCRMMFNVRPNYKLLLFCCKYRDFKPDSMMNSFRANIMMIIIKVNVLDNCSLFFFLFIALLVIDKLNYCISKATKFFICFYVQGNAHKRLKWGRMRERKEMGKGHSILAFVKIWTCHHILQLNQLIDSRKQEI